MKATVIKLIARIEDTASADVSLKDVRVLTKIQDPEVIDVLAGLLDDDGRVGREAVRALRRFGRAAEPTLRRCLCSHDEIMVAHAQDLLAALGETPAELPTTNDNDEPVPPDTTLLADPEVVRAIAGTLFTRGVPRQDVHDEVAEVQTRVLEMLRVGLAPTCLAEWRALACKVAAERAVDVLRKRFARRKHEEDLCEEPDAHAEEQPQLWDAVDARRLVAIYEVLLSTEDLPPLTAEILQAKVEGLTDDEIAEELGIPEDVVFYRRRVVRGRLGWRLVALGMGDLIPGPSDGARERDGEAARVDDLPASLPNLRRG